MNWRRTRRASGPALLLALSACASGEPPRVANGLACVEPRPQICTMDYRPVCATRCEGTPCASTETATYPNACGACADARVMTWLPGACPE